VLAGMNANLWDLGEDIQALVRSGAIINAESLADSSIPLAELT
jgi:3-phenylpropionate/trans-cinnamate dioxygenase ferredoxin reductase subunit